jgi:hypothetical protein
MFVLGYVSWRPQTLGLGGRGLSWGCGLVFAPSGEGRVLDVLTVRIKFMCLGNLAVTMNVSLFCCFTPESL